MQVLFTDYQKIKDKDGNVIDIFINLTVVDDFGNARKHECYLSESDRSLVLTDEEKLVPILERCTATELLNLEEELANRPQEAWIAPKNHKDTFVLSEQNILDIMEELKNN